MDFKSVAHLLDYFKKEETCIKYLEQNRWSDGVFCPHCNSLKPYKIKKGYKCSNDECFKVFNVKTGTIYQGSKMSLRTWFHAMYLAATHKKGISSVQLATDLGITQKTSWYMLQKIREMFKNQKPVSLGKNEIVEIDEAHIGGKEENRHTLKMKSKDNPELANDGTKYNKKKVVLGMIERNGNVILNHINSPSTEQVMPIIEQNLEKDSVVFTDESKIYTPLKKKYNHDRVNHSANIYVINEVHTNTIENFWSGMKRTINGTYVHISSKHLDRYLNEFAARFNSRHSSPTEKFNLCLRTSNTHITHKQLTA